MPFSSGLFISTVMSVYIAISSILGEKKESPWDSIGFAICGSIMGWIAMELFVIGLRMSKSALASYADSCGILVPFMFDAIALKRPILKTDWIAITLIISLQITMATRALRKKQEEI